MHYEYHYEKSPWKKSYDSILKDSILKSRDITLPTKEARIYNGAKSVSSINGDGKTGQLHVKE